MAEASRKANLGDTTIRDIFKRGRDPNIETFLKMCGAIGVPASYVLEGDERFAPKVPIIGYASGGEGWTPLEDMDEELEVKFSGTDPVAIGIRGSSMSPVYRDGDYLICHRIDGANIHNIIGKDCIIYTADNESYVKILQRGTTPTTYNLRSYNPTYPDIEDVKIKWAAPIVWVKRNNF